MYRAVSLPPLLFPLSLCLSAMLARLSFKWRRLLVSTPSSHSWRLRLGQSELGAVKRLHSQLVNAATHLCLPFSLCVCVCIFINVSFMCVCVWVCAILLEQLQHCSHHVCHFYNYFCYLLVNCVRAPPSLPFPHSLLHMCTQLLLAFTSACQHTLLYPPATSIPLFHATLLHNYIHF